MPDFTVIEGGGPEGRDRIFAEQDFKNALRAAAANMLRIIRGAGKPYELLIQLSDVVSSAAVKVREEITGQLPTDLMVKILQGESKTEAIWEKYGKGEIDKAAIDRWQEDGTIDMEYAESSIKAGVLQIIASQFVMQTSGLSHLTGCLPEDRVQRNDGPGSLAALGPFISDPAIQGRALGHRAPLESRGFVFRAWRGRSAETSQTHQRLFLSHPGVSG